MQRNENGLDEGKKHGCETNVSSCFYPGKFKLKSVPAAASASAMFEEHKKSQMEKKCKKHGANSFKIYDEVALQVHLVEHWGWSTSPLYSSMKHFFSLFSVVAAATELYDYTDYTIPSICCANTCPQ